MNVKRIENRKTVNSYCQISHSHIIDNLFGFLTRLYPFLGQDGKTFSQNLRTDNNMLKILIDQMFRNPAFDIIGIQIYPDIRIHKNFIAHGVLPGQSDNPKAI